MRLPMKQGKNTDQSRAGAQWTTRRAGNQQPEHDDGRENTGFNKLQGYSAPAECATEGHCADKH